MNTDPSKAGFQRCEGCGSPPSGDLSVGSCPACGRGLLEQNKPSVAYKVRQRLVWLAKAYRVWSLGLFAVAILHLILVGQFKNYFAAFLVILPFSTALIMSYQFGERTSGWIVTFLILVDLGVIIAPEQQILPKLNMFPQIPRTQNRILSWYILVYISLQFVALPPVAFFRSLRTAWRGNQPTLSPWICLLGFAVWILVVTIFTLWVMYIFKD